MRRPAIAHVVLGVDLEESNRRARLEEVAHVLGLQADPGTGRERATAVSSSHRRLTEDGKRHDRHARRQLDRLEEASLHLLPFELLELAETGGRRLRGRFLAVKTRLKS